MFDYQKVIWEIFLPANQSNLFYQFFGFHSKIVRWPICPESQTTNAMSFAKKDTALRQAERTEQRYLEVTWEDGPFWILLGNSAQAVI